MFCSKCGGNLPEGAIFCASCGTKVGVIEGTVEVKGKVSVDNAAKLENLYKVARRAREGGNTDQAFKYYEQLNVEDPDNWEPAFFVAYYSAVNKLKNDKAGDSVRVVGNTVKLGGNYRSGIGPSIKTITNCLDSVFNLIENIQEYDEKKAAVKTVSDLVKAISGSLSDIIKNEFDRMSSEISNFSNQIEGGMLTTMSMNSQNKSTRDGYNRDVSAMLALVEQREKRLEEERKQVVEAQRRSLQEAAEQGQAEAQFKLGLLYFNGEGVPKDFVRAAEWFRKAAGQGHTEAKGYIAKAETAEKEREAREKEAAERKAREEKERIQRELRGAKKYLTFINVSVLVGFIAGLVLLALELGLSLGDQEFWLIVAAISPLIGFYIPGFWPVLKHTWLIVRKIPSVVIGFLGGNDEGCLVNVIAGFIFLFSYPFIATFGAPINIIVTIVKYVSLRKEIKRLNR